MSIIPCALLALGLTLLAGGAQAADRALPELIGYSEDGRYFAFESYGVHDGSGAPYASMTVLDLDAEAGTRLASFADSGGEDDLLASLRAKVADEAKATLAKYELTQPAQFVSMAGDGDAAASGFTLPFGQPGGGMPGEVFEPSLVKLSTFTSDDKTGCGDYSDGGAAGLALDIVTTDQRRQIFVDGQTIPQWRGCPLDYRLYAVVIPYNGDMKRAVALISVYVAGWEGADRNFMALPLGQ